MFCPKCKSEYKESVTFCPMCNVPLVSEDPRQTEPEFIKFVTVYETGDPATIAFIKSILQSEGIGYFCKGEALQDLFAGGRLGTGFNPIVGSIKVQVDEKDAEKAKELLKQIEKGEFELLKDDAANGAEKVERDGAKRRTLKHLLIGFTIGVLVSVAGFIVYDYRENGLLAQIQIDTNSDNKPEILEYYSNEVLSEKVWIYESSRKIWKKALYGSGVLREEYVDQDYDGTFDIKITYDSSECPIKTYPLH